MTDTIIHVGDIGTVFMIPIVEEDGISPIDISGCTVRKILFKKSNGVKISKDAIFATDGKDGIIQYTGIDGDIDISGYWHMQGYIELPSGKFYSEITRFKVEKNLLGVLDGT
jgi:hypothetical protein